MFPDSGKDKKSLCLTRAPTLYTALELKFTLPTKICE